MNTNSRNRIRMVILAVAVAAGLLASMVVPAHSTAEPDAARLVVITTGGTIATSTDPSGVRRSAERNLPRASTSTSWTFSRRTARS